MTSARSRKQALKALAGQMGFIVDMLRKAADDEPASPSNVEGVLADAQAALDSARHMLSNAAPPRS